MQTALTGLEFVDFRQDVHDRAHVLLMSPISVVELVGFDRDPNLLREIEHAEVDRELVKLWIRHLFGAHIYH